MKKLYGVLTCIALFCGCADYVDGTVTEKRIVEDRWAGENATYSGPEYDVTFNDDRVTFEGNRELGEEIRLLREQLATIRREQHRRDELQARSERYKEAARRGIQIWEPPSPLLPLAD